MIVLNYTKTVVLAIFRQEDGNVSPSAAQIQSFDKALFDANDPTLLRIMGTEGIDTRKDNKSSVLQYSRSGAGTLTQRVLAACKFFKNTQAL